MPPNDREAIAGNCIVTVDTKAYTSEDALVSHGLLKQGAVIHITAARFRGTTPFSLVSGEGPKGGWVYFGNLQWEDK